MICLVFQTGVLFLYSRAGGQGMDVQACIQPTVLLKMFLYSRAGGQGMDVQACIQPTVLLKMFLYSRAGSQGTYVCTGMHTTNGPVEDVPI